MAQITIDRTACSRCGKCVDVCTIVHVFEMSDESAVPVRADACWRCGHCVAVCPTDAIDHEAFPLEECPIVEPSGLPSRQELVGAFRMRRSQRAFHETPIDRELVRELVDLSRWAPSASNSQAVDWAAFDDPARIEELSHSVVSEIAHYVRLSKIPVVRWLLPLFTSRDTRRQLRKGHTLVERFQAAQNRGEDPIFYGAPVVLIGHCPSRKMFSRDDSVYAAYNIAMVAETFGLGTCQIGFFQLVAERSGRMLRRIGLPAGRTPQVALALGYPRNEFRRGLPRRNPNLTWNTR
jgi:nitroreductase/NAD-dependent dihydropyrimidine dehydrogenase PreA subunit